MGENYAFFLPIMMAGFGIVFLIVWSWHVSGAQYWSAAFFCLGAAFAIPALFAAFPALLWGVIADLLFAAGFLLLSQALLQRWRPGWMLPVRLAIAALSVLLCMFAAALDNISLELVASDFGCFLLIALPLIAARGKLRGHADRALFAAASLVALDNLVRGSTVPLTFSGDADFFTSNYAFLMQALASVFGMFLALAALTALMMDLLARYQREAMVDPLSGLLNRRGFDEAVVKLGSQRPGEGSLIVCDIDHFKAVNDQYGHALGDRVISGLAQIFARTAPAGAIAARFGGEEFVLFLPSSDAARAAQIANELRESFSQEVASSLQIPHSLTASFGLSTVQRGDNSIHDAIARADEALYDAKARGRNRVCVRRALSAPELGPAPVPRIISA